MGCSVQDRPKNARQVKDKIKRMLNIFFEIKRIVHKAFALEIQTVKSTYDCDFYGDCVKMCEDSTPKLGAKEVAVASRQRTVSHFFFHQGIFYQKQHDCRPPPTLRLCFPN
jgi:hypothetical protein